MAIIYPRALPLGSLGNVEFDLQRYESTTLLRGGQTQVDERADPRWIAAYQTRPLLPAVNPADRLIMGEWEAFYNSLRGNDQTYLGYDPVHEYPAMHSAGDGLGGWNGIAQTSSISAFSLSVSSLPFGLGLSLSPGDHVSLRQNDSYSLHMILEARTQSGTSLTSLTVEPSIDTGLFNAGVATATFIKAVCEMQRIIGSWSAPKDSREAAPVRFQGIQIRR